MKERKHFGIGDGETPKSSAQFAASWWGACPEGDTIKPGDTCHYLDGLLRHVDCPGDVNPDEPQRNERQCPDCFCIHAGECP